MHMNLDPQKLTTSTTKDEKSLLGQYDESFLFKNALILIDHGDYDLAIHLLDTVLQGNASHEESLKWKGYCHSQLNQVDKAIEAFIKATELNPTEIHLFHLAESFYAAGQDGLAKDFYIRTLEKIDYESPHLFQIYKKLGNIATKGQDFESAEEYYDKAYTIMPHSDDLFVNYGTLEIQRGQWDLALDRFKHALNLNARNDKAWVGLSLIYRTRGDRELSWGELHHALDINPKNTVALKLAVDWGLQEMEYDFAIQALEKYLAIDSSQSDWVFTYAGLLYHAGDWKECKTVLSFLLSKYPDHIAAQDLLKKMDHKVNV